MSAWTDQRVIDLKKLWLDGFSASQIARKLGGVTRNAVVGKVHRLGLADRDRAAKPRLISPGEPPAPRPPMTARAPKPASKPARAPTCALVAVNASRRIERLERDADRLAKGETTIPHGPTSLSATCSADQLGRHMCKWPIGDPSSDTFGFCGRRADDGQAYCIDHFRVAYQPRAAGDAASALARSLRRYL